MSQDANTTYPEDIHIRDGEQFTPSGLFFIEEEGHNDVCCYFVKVRSAGIRLIERYCSPIPFGKILNDTSEPRRYTILRDI